MPGTGSYTMKRGGIALALILLIGMLVTGGMLP